MPGNPEKLPHIFLSIEGLARSFKPIGGGGRETPVRKNPISHGRRLRMELDKAMARADDYAKRLDIVSLGEASGGYYLEFDMAPGVPLPLEKLENQKKGVEILTVRYDEQGTRAVVFVPHNSKSLFAEKISAYLSDRRTPKNRRLNRPLVDAIDEIDFAGLRALWTGLPEAFPAHGSRAWWEVWVRSDAKKDFERVSEKLKISRYSRVQKFIDRIVVLLHATVEELDKIRIASAAIAELRSSESAAPFFVDLPADIQAAAAEDLARRVTVPADDALAVTILDNGVNNAHPLIRSALAANDVHVVDPAWPMTDNPHTHGSGIAGLVLYGDLSAVIASAEPIELNHRLESVRILPVQGMTDPALYGAVTAEAVARTEAQAPNRRRVFCLSVTATGTPETGRPSAWSAEIDRLACGQIDADGTKRLMMVAVGNVRDRTPLRNYLDHNLTSPCESPSQAWNALSVGAFTEIANLDDRAFPNWSAIAPAGELAPSSRTSLMWGREWPVKPEVLLEGGNWALDPTWQRTDSLEQLSLLTTSSRVPNRYFDAFGDTSAATALGSQMAATIAARYQEYWPETVRALIVHSAEWTSRMQQKFDRERISGRGKLLRIYGYGVPNVERALHSASNELTLVTQSKLKPYKLEESRISLNEVKLFALPWPSEALRALGDQKVEMRVTLSYFVEPNPADRGWRGRHKYRSHGLRFKMKRANEDISEFHMRINQAARDEEDEDYQPSVIEQDNWYLGPRNRDVGSIHSDFLIDSAANVAERGVIAVHPVSGWWKERKALNRYKSECRFSLIVSIRSDQVEIDLYTPVANLIETQIQI